MLLCSNEPMLLHISSIETLIQWRGQFVVMLTVTNLKHVAPG